MKNGFWMLGLCASLFAIGCSDLGDKHFARASDGKPSALAEDDDGDDDGDDEDIALDLVPASVKQAAVAAVPGLVLQEAEKEIDGGITVYCLEGRVGSDEYEVEVSADGKVREIDKHDGDDKDDDDGDDEEDDD